MSSLRLDQSLRALRKGYGWLPDARREAGSDTVRTRVLGQRAVALCGPAAARFFYDETHVRRSTAIPLPVQDTLFGRGAVHTLDADAHRRRKELFLSLLGPDGVRSVADEVATTWDAAAAAWPIGEPVVLFDEASRVLTRAVTRWAGVPLDDADVPAAAADLVAMVDGFATAGPRHWRARRARARREAWLSGIVDDVRNGSTRPVAGSAVEAVSRHRDADGRLLDLHTCAVELLNILRPTVAVCWFVAFSAHALHRWPENRARLREGDTASAEAFVHEVRRLYPFAPFVGGRAVGELSWHDCRIPAGSLVLLDIYGQHHSDLYDDPYAFRPSRFQDKHIDRFELLPQGGGDARAGHRCPGEGITIAVLQTIVLRLAASDYAVPAQDMRISLRRIPAKPRSGVVITPALPVLATATGAAASAESMDP